MTTKLSKAAALSLDLTAKLAEHLDGQTEVGSISKTKVVKWVLRRKLDPRRRFTDKQRRLILRRDEGLCFYCQEPAGSDWEADHVLPWSMGGQTVLENGVCACRDCNNTKSNKVW